MKLFIVLILLLVGCGGIPRRGGELLPSGAAEELLDAYVDAGR